MKFEILFKELNEELAQRNMNLNLICVGGFVMDYYSIRSTQDVNAFFNSNYELDQLIKKVGDKLNANTDELWLNNSVSNMNPTPDIEICTMVYSLSHINLYIPPIEYIIGMKSESLREQDIKDIGELIKVLKDTNPYKLKNKIDGYGFNIDESVLLEGYGEAYGIDWLVNFYKNNDLSYNLDDSDIYNELNNKKDS